MALGEVAINSTPLQDHVAASSSNAQVDSNNQLLAPGEENMRAASPAFHSMLKTATETGDLGIFGLNPSLLPQLNPHALPRGKRNGSRQSELALPPRDSHGPNQDRFHRESSGSFYSSARIAKGRKTSRATSQGPSDGNGRSHSLTDNARPVHHLARHRSYANIGRYEGALDFDRSRSPFAYPTRLKRLGYRPTSPALSDQVSPGYRTNSGITKGQKSRTKSPSAPIQSRVPSEFSRNSNRLFSLHQANVIPSFASRYYGQPSRGVLTPKSSIYRGSVTSSVNGSQPTLLNQGGQKGLPTSALYYDYTEDFEDDFNNQGSRSGPSWPLYTIDATIPEAQSSGNDLYLKQLSNGEPALTKWLVDKDQQPGSLSPKEQFPLQVDDGFPNSVQPSEHMAETEAARASAGVVLDRHSSSSTHSSLPRQGISFTDSNHSRGGSSFSSPVVSSPDQFDSLKPCKENGASSNKSNEPLRTSATRGSAIFSLPSWKLPSMKFSHVDLVGRAIGPSLARATSSDGLAETDHTGIFAPVPERPLTSEGHRGTYNSFSPIDEGLAELAKALTTFEATDRPYTPDQFIRDSLRSSTILRNSTISRLSRQSAKDPSASPREPGDLVTVDDLHPPYELEDVSNSVTGDQTMQPVNGKKHSPNILELPLGVERSAHLRSPRRVPYISDVECSSNELEIMGGNSSPFALTASPGAHPPSYINDDIAAHIRPRKASLVANKISPPLKDVNSDEPFPQLIPQEETYEGTHSPLFNENLPLGDGLPSITVRKSSLQSTRAPTILAPGSNFPQLSKDLPRFPRESSLVAPTPLASTGQSQLPLPATSPRPASTFGLKPQSENPAVDDTSAGSQGSKGHAIKQKFKVKRRSIRPPSRASSPESRPWNDDESYPWTNIPPDIEMRLPPPPPPAMHRDRHISKPPLFKVRTRKSSAATDATVKINRAAAAPASDRPLSAPTDLFMSGSKIHSTQRLFGNLGRRFGYGGRLDNERNDDLVSETGTENGTTNLAPSINLAIPSPTLNPAEVRSFFSDDSSLVRHRGSMRQRFSQFRSRLPSSRKSSSDEVRDTERIAAAFSVRRGRLDRRTSEDFHQETVGMSNIEYQVRKVVQTVKGWFQKVRGIGPRKKSRDFHANPGTELQADPANNNAYYGL
ncbi:MAG: hypothetical protein M1836_001308 [Candelina mexicana]|nr:MAG: hypothetical protein M1836_001308 [Candelina mexicana]